MAGRCARRAADSLQATFSSDLPRRNATSIVDRKSRAQVVKQQALCYKHAAPRHLEGPPWLDRAAAAKKPSASSEVAESGCRGVTSPGAARRSVRARSLAAFSSRGDRSRL